tara:strand:- start:88 stop:357 length:270 start_codon:yes stop_codon:yes gene_type:complete
MANKRKILSDLSKMALDAMSTVSGAKKEIETIIKLKVDKAINKMNLVKRDEFEVLQKLVQKLLIQNEKLKKKQAKPSKKVRTKGNKIKK